MKQGSYFVDHTTSTASLAQEIYDEGKQLGVKTIDAPVSGGSMGAAQGQLVTMCGAGDRTNYEDVAPLLDCYSREHALLGGPGAGQYTKMAN